MLFDKVREYVRGSDIEKLLKNKSTVIVGYSGGADSGVLLSFFLSERKNYPDLQIIAAHVNHMIRGEEAERDEEFCRRFCLENGVTFECERIDVPALSRERATGLEETARVERYAYFERLSKKYGDALIATAHNSDDNLETLIFNLSRGSGTKGLSGISPVRDDRYIRPLLSCTSEEIRTFAGVSGIAYVTDSTNCNTAYTRNSIRQEIVPILKKLNPKACDAALRLSQSAREDCDFIEGEARRLLLSGVTSHEAKKLHPALFQRVLLLMYREKAGSCQDLSKKNITDCKRLLESAEGGSVSLPRRLAFFADQDEIYIKKDPRFDKDSSEKPSEPCLIVPGETVLLGTFCITCTRNGNYIDTIDENVYKLSLHTALDCDKIVGKIYVRTRKSGDTVRMQKMSKKLKKLFCDKNVPRHLRDKLPVFEDSDGIVFVPLIGERDGCSANEKTKNVLNLHIYERS